MLTYKSYAKYAVIPLLLILVVTAGCSGMNTTEQRTLSGGAIGAGAGAVVSGLAGGNPVTGGLIGAAAGALGGYLYDQNDRRHR